MGYAQAAFRTSTNLTVKININHCKTVRIDMSKMSKDYNCDSVPDSSI